ncbi:hypothetical protein BKA65DRAFT_215871 [Rhexocercosporidium sp. MPI-PUGE-AT-0058]|nr:hypothetical protein BKA65DRAFT_215871 [Rhexocercosporidium sp. MPI-PUGE-AT-0058]
MSPLGQPDLHNPSRQRGVQKAQTGSDRIPSSAHALHARAVTVRRHDSQYVTAVLDCSDGCTRAAFSDARQLIPSEDASSRPQRSCNASRLAKWLMWHLASNLPPLFLSHLHNNDIDLPTFLHIVLDLCISSFTAEKLLSQELRIKLPKKVKPSLKTSRLPTSASTFSLIHSRPQSTEVHKETHGCLLPRRLIIVRRTISSSSSHLSIITNPRSVLIPSTF